MGSNCCDPDATTINQNCINGCGIHLSVCGRQGSGPSTCSNTTSSILVGHNATFEENANYGGLQNPIQVMLGNLSSEVSHIQYNLCTFYGHSVIEYYP